MYKKENMKTFNVPWMIIQQQRNIQWANLMKT